MKSKDKMDIIVRNNYFRILETDQRHGTNWEMFIQEVLMGICGLWAWGGSSLSPITNSLCGVHMWICTFAAKGPDLIWCRMSKRNPCQGTLLKTTEKQSKNNRKWSGIANITPLMPFYRLEQATNQQTSHNFHITSGDLVLISSHII